MKDFDIRQRMREGYTLEADEGGKIFLRHPDGDKDFDRSLPSAIARMVKGSHPLLREEDCGVHRRRWVLC